jgi:GNAT superfamily N-acetyltransferase
MIIRHPNQADWRQFSALSAGEGWRVPQSELRLFQETWSQNAYVLEDDGFCGFVTAVAYEKSAWIGNLIVQSDMRSKGYGSRLFTTALHNLLGRGMTSVWLTASELGLPIYEKEGFVKVGMIERWLLAEPRDEPFYKGGERSDCSLLSADREVWGENRSMMLSELTGHGQVFSAGNSVALLQVSDDIQVLGPWYSEDASEQANHEILQQVVTVADTDVELVADVIATPASNRLFESCGFTCSGRTVLMASGEIGAVDLRKMISLASLGSFG